MTNSDGVRRVLQAGLIAISAFAAMFILAQLPLFSLLELKGLDVLFRLRGPLAPPSEIVMVAIDEPSFAEISKQWPWPRSLHARLIDQLKRAGARVIGFDILFAELSQSEEDRALARAIREAGNVVLAGERAVIADQLFRHTMLVDPVEPLKVATAIGIATLPIEPDGTVRRPFPDSTDLPSFALQIVRLYLGDRQHGIGADPSRAGLINHLGPPRTVKTVSYYQVLEADRMLPPGIFTDKIVVIGRALQAEPEPQRTAPDLFLTPFSPSAGSLTASRVLVLDIYDHAFRYFEMGYASAMAWVLFLIIMAFTLVQLYLQKRWVYYEVTPGA